MDFKTQMKIASNLTELRIRHKFTQDLISNKLHISRSGYSLFENGHRLPDIDIFLTLANIYNVRMDTFFQMDNYKFQQEILFYQSGKSEESELINLYHNLSVFSQGQLIERGRALLEND